MKQKELIKIIKKHEWWREEAPAVHQIAEWAWRGFIESSKYFDKRYLTIGFFIYKNNYLYELTSRFEKIEQYYFLFDKLKKNKNYLKKKIKKWLDITIKTTNFGYKFTNEIDTISNKELARRYKEFTYGHVEQARYCTFGECVDPFTEDELPRILEKELPKITSLERSRIANTMSHPECLSFMEEGRIDFLKSCLKIIDKKSNIKKEANRLEDKYFWIECSYGYLKVKKAGEFEKEINRYIKKKTKTAIKKELGGLNNKIFKLRKEKQKLTKKYKLNSELQKIFQIINELGEWIDVRKKYMTQLTLITYQILYFLEKKFKVNYDLIGYTTFDELYEWLAKGKKIPTKILKERKKLSVYLPERIKAGKARAKFIIGKDAQEIYNTFFPKQNIKELKGTVASVPQVKITGEVSVVINVSKDEFKDGSILVASMTRPEYLPLMHKAKAIITDEGGLTCHAAIVSRELNIPCIIGAKFATKILKSGDIIDVDTESGIVKIIK